MGKWEMARLGEVFYQIKNGASIKQGVVDGGIPITRIETISDGTINREKLGYAGVSDDKYSNFYLEDGDILMSHINSEKHLGKVALYIKKGEEQIIHGMNLLCLKSNGVIKEYMYYFFKSNVFKNQIPPITKKSVNQASFTVTALKNLSIPLPPLDEQKRIAKNLDLASEIVKGYKEQLAELDKLVQSVFYDMFGDPVTNEKDWTVQKLKDITSLIQSGNTPKGGKQVYIDFGIMFFRSQNVWRNRIELDDIAYIDEVTHKKMSKTSLKHNDILITKTGRFNTENSSLGRAALYSGSDNSANINGHVYLVRLNTGVAHKFILHILTTDEYREYIRSVCVGGIDKRQINKEHLEEFPIIVPPLPLQNRFATIVTEIEVQKAQVQQTLTEAENLFNSLMQEYFE